MHLFYCWYWQKSHFHCTTLFEIKFPFIPEKIESSSSRVVFWLFLCLLFSDMAASVDGWFEDGSVLLMVNTWCWGLCISFSCLFKFHLFLAILSSFLIVSLIDSLTSQSLTFLSSTGKDFLWILSVWVNISFVSSDWPICFIWLTNLSHLIDQFDNFNEK